MEYIVFVIVLVLVLLLFLAYAGGRRLLALCGKLLLLLLKQLLFKQGLLLS